MATADDQRLLELAAEPAGELFPILRQAAAFRPLLLLLAVLPGLYALANRTLTDTDAAWALASVELASQRVWPASDTPGADVEQAAEGRAADVSAAAWRPPLAVWLTALVMRVFGTDQPIAVVLVSYLATIALVVLVYHVFGRLGDARLGLWTAVLVALHGPVLAQAQTPVPISLGCVLALGSAWGLFVHVRTASAPVSLVLLLAGVSLGLCVLAAGPLAGGVVAWLAVSAFAIPPRRPTARVVSHPAVARRRTSWPPPVPLAVLLLTAFAVGGWWPLMTAWEHGLPDLSTCLALGLPPTVDAALESGGGWLPLWQRLYHECHESFGALAGLFVLGLWRAVRVGSAAPIEARSTGDGNSPAWLRFLVIWTAVGVPAWWLVIATVPESRQAAELWRGFAILPVLGLAAFAADEIAHRRIGVVGAFTAALLSLALAVEPQWWQRLYAPPADPTVLTLVLLAAGPLAIALLWLMSRHNDDRQQTLLTLLIVGHLAGNAALGFLSVHRQTDDDRALAAFRREIAAALEERPVEESQAVVASWTLISDVEPPLTLWYVLRSQWPEAIDERVESWDAALAGALGRRPTPERRYVVVEWSTRETQPANIQVPGLQVVPAGRAQFYRGRQLRGFLVAGIPG